MADLPSFELVLSTEERAIVKRALAKAIVAFQDELLRDVHQHGGSLCQVWLPELTEDGSIHLKTKDLPFCVAGSGDLLALFRCISSRYSFGTDQKSPNKLGAPGRVFLSSEPEASRNVQKYGKEVYLRTAGAQQCNIHSTLLVPLFRDADCARTVGVLEVVQNTEDMQFGSLIGALNRALKRYDLYTHDPGAPLLSRAPSQLSGEAPAVQNGNGQPAVNGQHHGDTNAIHGLRDLGTLVQEVKDPPLVTLENSTTSLEKLRLTDEAGDTGTSSHKHAHQHAHQHAHAGGAVFPAPSPVNGVGGGLNGVGGGNEGGSPPGHVKHEMMMDGGDSDDETGGGAKKGGKTGRSLSLEDLQSQFGVGLKEAAQRLGICPTTLKRACRRHGIQRWPRRQLLKISKAIDQIQASTNGPDVQLLGNVPGLDPKDALASKGVMVPDDRWTCLAQLIPGIAGASQQHGGPRPLAYRSNSDDGTPPMPTPMQPISQQHQGGNSQHMMQGPGVMMGMQQQQHIVVGSYSSTSGKVDGIAIPHVHSSHGLPSMAPMAGMATSVGDMSAMGSMPQGFPAEMEAQYQQWKASSDAAAMYAGTPAINPTTLPTNTSMTASSQAMMYGAMGHMNVATPGSHMYMQQPMQQQQHMMPSPMLEGLTPGLDMAFVDNGFDGQGGDDFYAADPEVLGLIAVD